MQDFKCKYDLSILRRLQSALPDLEQCNAMTIPLFTPTCYRVYFRLYFRSYLAYFSL